jgi:membrane-associated phospholipid phosphatase
VKALLYDWGGLNVWLFHVINNLRGEFIDKFMLLGTSISGYENFYIYIALISVVALFSIAQARSARSDRGHEQTRKWFSIIAVLSISFYIDSLLVFALKEILDFPRPPQTLPEGSLYVIGKPQLHYSLPSGHAVFATMIAAALWPALNRYWRIAAVFFLLWVGISRVSLGAHFPADVLAGFLLSLLVVVLVRFLINRSRVLAVSEV